MAFRCCFTLFLLFYSSLLLGQKIQGRLQHNRLDVANIHILNTSSKKATISDSHGYFEITAQLYDTLEISSVQFKRKMIPISLSVLESTFLQVEMEEKVIELDEVVLRPFDLSGELFNDIDDMYVGEIITESTLDLPNANIRIRTKNERLLYTARTWDFKGTSFKLDPIINALSGRTVMLKKRVARDKRESKYNEVYAQIPDSLVINGLSIPKDKLYQFYFYCEADKAFDSIVNRNIQGDIWDYLVQKSEDFRRFNK